MRIYNYRIQSLAETQISEIYLYGLENWGIKQADKYYDFLIDHIQQICDNPFQYPVADAIASHYYRKSVFEKHVIYYTVEESTVVIKAIIGQQDILRLLKEGNSN